MKYSFVVFVEQTFCLKGYLKTILQLFMREYNHINAIFVIRNSIKQNQFGDICPKNLTFPEAKREQRCPRLVVVIFCLFFSICQSDLSFTGVNQSNFWIKINKQKMTTTKCGHCCSRLAFGKVRFSGH